MYTFRSTNTRLYLFQLSIALGCMCLLSTELPSCTAKSKPTQPLCKSIFQAKLRNGDLVFRRGRSVVSNIILMSDHNSSYSHVGIVLVENKKVMVVHITPGEKTNAESYDIIKKEELLDFFSPKRAAAGCAMRYKLKDEAEQRLTLKTLELLNRKLPFDTEYNLEDTTKMYCTELVWYIYKTAGVDLVAKKISTIKLPLLEGPVILPSDIASNPNLKVVAQF